MNYKELLYNIKNENSTLKKINLLKKADILFKKILLSTYNNKVYHVKSYNIPKAKKYKDISIIFPVLDKLSYREITGNAALELVEKTFSLLSEEDQNIFDRILQKDLKIGINVKLINKAIPNLIPVKNYMGAVPYSDKKLNNILKSDIIIDQEKMDGEFAFLEFNSSTQAISRNNKKIYLPEVFWKNCKYIYEIYTKDPEDIIFHGELLIKNIPRYQANGLITRISKIEEKLKAGEDKEKLYKQFYKKTSLNYEEIINDIYYSVWDVLDYNIIPTGGANDYYIDRLLNTLNYIENIPVFELTDTIIYSKTDDIVIDEEHSNKIKNKLKISIIKEDNKELFNKIMARFKEIIQNGGEGTIIKDGLKKFSPGKPVFQIKLKFEFECELKIVGFKQGSKGTKYENSLGAFIATSEDNQVNADPSGIIEDLRDEIWANPDKYKNKIITVKCNGLSKNLNNEYSLLHPRFIKFREDKSKADSLQDIINIENGLINPKNIS